VNSGQQPSLWNAVRGWFAHQATHVTVEFLPDPDAQPLDAYGGYVRLWFAEGFLGHDVSWSNKQFPVLHAGVALNFLGQDGTAFSTFTQQSQDVTVRGAFLDYRITPLVPFNGGTVEIQAALYRATVEGPLGNAVALAGNLASLVGPPLATAATVVQKVSAGLGQILDASKDDPVLGVHYTMVSPGGGLAELRPGMLVVAAKPAHQLGGTLVLGADGRVALATAGGNRPLTGTDYLALRVECRTERDDWRFPELDTLIKAAQVAAVEGNKEAFERRRTAAVARAWDTPDLVGFDHKRVADLVERMIGLAGAPGIIARSEDLTLDQAAPQYLLARDAPQLDGLTFDQLLARTRS
jgi:hypothetical protein